MDINGLIRIEIDKIHRLITLTDNPLISGLNLKHFTKSSC